MANAPESLTDYIKLIFILRGKLATKPHVHKIYSKIDLNNRAYFGSGLSSLSLEVTASLLLQTPAGSPAENSFFVAKKNDGQET